MHALTKRESKAELIDWKGLLSGEPDYLPTMVAAIVQATLEAEMTAALGAEKGERTAARLGYRSGYSGRSLITRVGTMELRVPQDRQGRFSTELCARYQRSEKALVTSLIERDVHGVSTRKVKAVTEELCGHECSAAAISTIVKKLDSSLKAFCERRLTEADPYLIRDARYERVREGGAIESQAVLIAVAVDWEGRRQIVAVNRANRESPSRWKDVLLSLKNRGLPGVEVVVSDDHAGLKKAIPQVLPEAAWQRGYVHFLRTVLAYLPRRATDDGLKELRWMDARRELSEVRRDLAQWLAKWQGKYERLCGWVEDNIAETLTYYRLPLAHHKHMKSTTMLERLNQEIKRRTPGVRVFPNAESCLRLIRARCREA